MREEIRVAEADRQKPLRREQPRGPQHQVKPAASKDLQGESRATHVLAKAIHDAQRSGVESVSSLSGVGGAARVEGNSGTSYASPFVAGIAACLLEKYPDMTPAELETRIKATASHTADAPAAGRVAIFHVVSTFPKRRVVGR